MFNKAQPGSNLPQKCHSRGARRASQTARRPKLPVIAVPPKELPEPPLNLADRLALRPKEAAQVLGVSERTLLPFFPSY